MPNRHIEDVLKLWSSTIDDLNTLQSFLSIEKINDQFYRRLFLRSIFSIIETYLYITKEVVKIKLSVEGNSNNEILWSELVILNEKQVLLDEQGKVKTKDIFQKFGPSLRFSLDIFANVFGSNLPDYGDKKFELLTTLNKRRNDITHPKSSNELIITDQEIKDSISMFGWFIETHNKMNKDFIEWYSGFSLADIGITFTK